MLSRTAIAIIVAIVVVCLIVCARYWIGGRKRRHQRKLRETYAKSAGGADAYAYETLHSLRNTIDPFERFARGYIRRYNMADMQRTRTPEAVARDYIDAVRAIADGQLPEEPIVVGGGDGGSGAQLVNFADFIVRELDGLIDEETVALNVALLDDIRADVEAAREQVLGHYRRRSGPRIAGNVAAAVSEQLQNMGNVLSDAQNVHDSSVVKNLRGIATRLQQLHPVTPRQVSAALDELRGWCTAGSTRDTQALTALDSIIEDAEKDTEPLHAYGHHTRDLLAQMWLRHTATENVGKETIIKDAIKDALHDCVEDGNMVCKGGKAARVLGALVTIDADRVISSGGDMTTSMVRHEVFNACSRLVEDAAAELDDPATTEPARERLQKEFESVIAQYVADGRLTDNDASRLLADCIAAVI